MIVACVGLYDERVSQASETIKRLRPHVDRYIIIADESVTEDQKKMLADLGCEVFVHPWEDSMVKMRNQYLNKAGVNDWLIVHDPDESFNEQFCNDVHSIVEDAERRGVDLLLINSHDLNHDSDGETRISISNYFKNLIFKKRAGTSYYGVGEVPEVHETLVIPGCRGTEQLNKEKYWYTHEKHYYEVWERATRNVFIAGGGNNRGTGNKSWLPLKQLCNNLGLRSWPLARQYFRRGNIDQRLKEWLWENRFEGYDYQHEMMEFGRWYFEYLHPEEAKYSDGRIWKPANGQIDPRQEVMRYVENMYLQVLGRHGDQEGKEVYTDAIVSGRVKREELPEIFRQSKEYRDKVQK